MKLCERGEVRRQLMVERRSRLRFWFDGVTQSPQMLQARAGFDQPDSVR
jgi:hypothetical protein